MRKELRLTMGCLLLLPLLTGCTAGAEQRTGEAEGYGGPLKVTVTLNGADITAVKIIEHQETEGVGTRAIDALPDAIAKADSIDVDGVSGATVTSNAIKQAVSQAMGMAGVMQDVIPMDGKNAIQAEGIPTLQGVGMAATGRVGPGKDSDGKQVYSFNVVFASGVFDEDGKIRTMKVDQLEVVSPNLGGGSAFSGFPAETGGEDAFLREVSAWTTKGAKGEEYMLPSGSWRAQMDRLEQQMQGKTIDEVKTWAQGRTTASASGGSAASGASAASETEVTDASDAGTAQVTAPEGADAATSAPDGGSATPDAATGATISLQGEYGDILLAIERAWEDAQRTRENAPGTMVDTNTVPDTGEGEANLG